MSEDNQDLSEEEQLKKLLEEDEEYLTRNEDGTVTLELEEPIEYNDGSGNRKREKLTFRRSKGKDWVASDKMKGEIGKTMMLASSITGVPKEVLEEMDGEDFLRCLRVTNTMGKSPTAGKTSSET